MRNSELVLLFKIRVGTHTYGPRTPPPLGTMSLKITYFFFDGTPKLHSTLYIIQKSKIILATFPTECCKPKLQWIGTQNM